jgi:ABC-type multidrug transport system fused ATPase/permease subunit
MGQILNSIRVVKYFAFESSVEDEVMKIRNVELATRVRLAKSQVVSGMTYTATSTFVLFIALYVHSLRGFELDAALIFTCVSLFGILEGPIGELSHHLSRVTNAFVGAKRILNYLKEEEVFKLSNEESNQNIEFKNVSIIYDEQMGNVLSDISFKLNHGESLAIVGEVGAGKTTLLYSLLGEIPLNAGEIIFNHQAKISYLPQEAYIINDTLKNNILFGETFNEEKFQNALYYFLMYH